MIDEEDLARLCGWADESSNIVVLRRRMASHPRFPDAARLHASNMLAAADADRTLDGVFKDAGRYTAALSAVYLHYAGELTLPRLKELCAATGWTSHGRARALLLYLRYLGYVELSPSHNRGKAAQYAPTVRFLAAWRMHIETALEAAAVIEPAIEHLRERLALPDVFETFARTGAACILASAKLLPQDEAYVRVFMHRNAGSQLVSSLLTADTGDVFPPRDPIPISLAASARRFGVSRIHVRRLLNAAEREGLLRYESEGRVTLTEKGRTDIESIYVAQFIQILKAAAKTFAAMPDLHLRPAPIRERDRDDQTSSSRTLAEVDLR